MPIDAAISRALAHAFNVGACTADGYRDALCGMGSRNNLGQGDDNASRVRTNWNTDGCAKVAAELVEALKAAGWTPPGEATTPPVESKQALSVSMTTHAVRGLDCGSAMAVRVIEIGSESGVWKEAYASYDEMAAFARGVEAGASLCGRGVRSRVDHEGAGLRPAPPPKNATLACPSCGS